MKVTLFIPCYIDLSYPQVGVALVRIFEKLGHKVECIEEPACCGQPSFNSGYWDESRPPAIKLMEQMKKADVVVTPSGSCGAMIKVFYPDLFKGTPYEALAREVCPKCFEFTQFLVNKLGITDLGAHFPHKVTYHDGCHSLREMKIHDEPRKLLAKVKDLQFVEMNQVVCCGFGGTFSAKMPMISTAMGEVKCSLAEETGAEYIVSGDASCLMHIQGLIDKQKRKLKTIHLAELLTQQ